MRVPKTQGCYALLLFNWNTILLAKAAFCEAWSLPGNSTRWNALKNEFTLIVTMIMLQSIQEFHRISNFHEHIDTVLLMIGALLDKEVNNLN